MRRVIVERPNDWYGHFARLNVVLDGTVVARLRARRSCTVEISPGEHEVWGYMQRARCDPVCFVVPETGDVKVFVSLPFWRLSPRWGDRVVIKVLGA